MGEHPVDPKLMEALAGIIRAASNNELSEGASLEAAEIFIDGHHLVSLDPGQIVVGPESDGVLVEWGPGAFDYYDEHTADSVRELMPGDYPCRPVYLGPVQEGARWLTTSNVWSRLRDRIMDCLSGDYERRSATAEHIARTLMDAPELVIAEGQWPDINKEPDDE